MLLNAIGRRYHNCLSTESAKNPNLADEMSDAELIHSVCRNERLTFFNFLKEHASDPKLNSEEGLKEQLNAEYGIYFRRKDQVTKAREMEFYEEPWWMIVRRGSSLRGNTLNKRFNVEYEKSSD